MYSQKFSWTDIGTRDKFYKANKSFLNKKNTFDFSKKDEYIYFIEDKIIKYFADNRNVKNRYLRSKELKGLTPKIENIKNNFYSYKKIEGNVLYDLNNPEITLNLLTWLNKNLWIPKLLEESELINFSKLCKEFYLRKIPRKRPTWKS